MASTITRPPAAAPEADSSRDVRLVTIPISSPVQGRGRPPLSGWVVVQVMVCLAVLLMLGRAFAALQGLLRRPAQAHSSRAPARRGAGLDPGRPADRQPAPSTPGPAPATPSPSAATAAPTAPSRAPVGPRDSGLLPLGADMEDPGVAGRAFAEAAARADPTKEFHRRELVFVGVGDTRDRRRFQKDPVLSRLSPRFTVSQLRRLEKLGIRHHLLLSTGASLCQSIAEIFPGSKGITCVTSSLFTGTEAYRTALGRYLAQPDDLFVLWAQTWRYVALACELGYGALRVDGDVHFAEDPYPLLWGPLFQHFALLTQVDFAGSGVDIPAMRARNDLPNSAARLQGVRPRCGWGPGDQELPFAPYADGAPRPPPPTCGQWLGPLINCGLVYLRRGSPVGGGAHAVVNGTWTLWHHRLVTPPEKPHPDMLVDQPYFRDAANRQHSLTGSKWEVRQPDAAAAYPPGACPYGAACGAVGAARSRVPFVVGRLAGQRGTADWACGLPDWFVGRACALNLPASQPPLRAPPPAGGPLLAPHCPSAGAPAIPLVGAAGAVVAVHMVYAKAEKRQKVFRALGWWDGEAAPQGAPDPQAALQGAARCAAANGTAGLLGIGHTTFMPPGAGGRPPDATPRLLLCAAEPAGGCPCCAAVAPPLGALQIPAERQSELAHCATWNFFE